MRKHSLLGEAQDVVTSSRSHGKCPVTAASSDSSRTQLFPVQGVETDASCVGVNRTLLRGVLEVSSFGDADLTGIRSRGTVVPKPKSTFFKKVNLLNPLYCILLLNILIMNS
jgi:hypothetical protein